MVYVENLNLLGTPKELIRIIDYLKMKFEMIDFEKTKFCLIL